MNWTNGSGIQVSTSATYTFTAASNQTLTANFVASNYTITANASANGTVTGGGSYTLGQSVTLTATPNTSYNFVSWLENGNVVSTNPTLTFNATSNRTLVATFAQATYTVTVSTSGNGTVTGGGSYANNSSVILTATPNSGYQFTNWVQNGIATPVSTNPSYTITVTQNISLNANFIPLATSNVTWTKTPYNSYLVTWTGPRNPIVTLQNGTGNTTVVYTTNGYFNSAAFPGSIAAGTYEVYLGGSDTQKSVTVASASGNTPVVSTTVVPTNVTFTHTQYGTYLVTWTGPKTATVTLQNGTGNATIAYTANGTFNSAVFPSTVTPGTYELFIAGTDIQSITVAAPATNTTTPTTPKAPTNATFAKTQYGTYLATWTGPKTATVTLQNGTGNTTVAYTSNGYFNAAVFPSSVTAGTYELFINGIDMNVVATVASAITTTPVTPDAATNATFTKTQYGTFLVTWTGPKTATVTLQNGTGNTTVAYTANGTLNAAVFPSTLTVGTYELFINGTDMNVVATVAGEVTTPPTTSDAATNATFEKTQYGTFLAKWTGSRNAIVTLRNGMDNGTVAYTSNGSWNVAVFPNTLVPGTYELFINGTDMNLVVMVPVTNVTWTQTSGNSYKVTWTGDALATVTLQNGTGNETVAYTTDGSANTAVFTGTLTPGTYELFIAGADTKSVVVAVPPTNATFEKTQYGTYLVKWTGPKTATVTLQNGASNATVVYTANGTYNVAVFPKTINAGTYELFIGGADMQSVTIN